MIGWWTELDKYRRRFGIRPKKLHSVTIDKFLETAGRNVIVFITVHR